jgi:hypothetical protein
MIAKQQIDFFISILTIFCIWPRAQACCLSLKDCTDPAAQSKKALDPVLQASANA